MVTDKQLEANRLNAKKSHGPSTPESLAKSSQNALRHGVLSETLLVKGESADRLAELIVEFEAEFLPQTTNESAIVKCMATNHWRQMHIWSFESSTINQEIDRQELNAPEGAPPMSYSDRACLRLRHSRGRYPQARHHRSIRNPLSA